ncbi:LMBR1 domain-containing protein [Histoplasma capsulatum]|uniref:Probable lysosomal cobalamin transporter n=2 Tax=Histoplasma TaxID=5036 RepID=LMBD1_AJECN|nr:conserved hypothetical protein [Histoplasma mississippiense (nom. inval.)]A6QTW5.1 RecName: Full=Probable lysosomal cobalamin transporter [Histoplasma mississippiense (nom. inval.)]EDN02957.1 conserved hypothetical protein [Histoplasma mississippiense (nom. inval.)]QSS58570.1 LMBR1 domain-containing protein [Histoplasma capsulatum]
MALLQSSLIWVVYAIVFFLLVAVSSIFIYIYQTPSERSTYVTTVCIFTLTALLATVLLLPVDVALVSSTTSSREGRRKSWATQDEVDKITFSLAVAYYFLYSLDAVLCLLVVPFTYFWYEEYDEVASEDGSQTFRKRFWGAFKYTVAFILLTVILFLVGFFVPIGRRKDKPNLDLDYFRRLLTENHGERALTFALGLLITIGILVYVLYTSTGLALLPVTIIKSAPAISSPTLSANTASRLEENIERQRQLEGRCGGNPDRLPSKQRRELDSLVRQARTLRRRQRLAEEARRPSGSWLLNAWFKLSAVFRPLKLLSGLLLLAIAMLVWVSMLLTSIDKAMNSICKQNCGYILGKTNILNPINWVFVHSSKVFPVDYILFVFLVLVFFCSSVVGIATTGIRFLWVRIFQLRKGHTSPQALLITTVMLTLITLALNYSISMVVAPQYATYGPQTFCDHPPKHPGEQPDCTGLEPLIKPCSELSENPTAKEICTPTVVSTFLNRITLNFPFFGIVDFWAQFFFLGLSLLVFLVTIFRTPKLDEQQFDEDAEAAEEEGLLASTGRRFGATWEDITGRASRSPQVSGSAGRGTRE